MVREPRAIGHEAGTRHGSNIYGVRCQKNRQGWKVQQAGGHIPISDNKEGTGKTVTQKVSSWPRVEAMWPLPVLGSQVLENQRQYCGSQLWVHTEITEGTLKNKDAQVQPLKILL